MLSREQHQMLARATRWRHFERHLRGLRLFDDQLRGLASVPSLAGIVLHRLYEAADRFTVDDNEGQHDAFGRTASACRSRPRAA